MLFAMNVFSQQFIDTCDVSGPVLHARGTRLNATSPLPPYCSEFSQGDKQINT